jgi:hypothetical protein
MRGAGTASDQAPEPYFFAARLNSVNAFNATVSSDSFCTGRTIAKWLPSGKTCQSCVPALS